jgi:taurine transport system permease protein
MVIKIQRSLWTERALILCLWLAVWGLIVEVFEVSSDFLPNPVEVMERIITLSYEPIGAGTLVTHAAASVTRLLSGFVSALLLGVPLGLLMAYFRPINWAVTPIFELFRYIPTIAWAPFALFWFGAGNAAQAYVIFTSAFPPILINSFLGVKLIDTHLLNAGLSLGARTWTILTEIALPAAFPLIMTGVRIGLAAGWMALIAAEIVAGTGTRDGLGYLILQGQQQLHADLTIGAMAVISVIGVFLDSLLRRVERHFSAWRV